MEKLPAFGPRLRELREAAGITQVALAEKAGLHPQGIVKLERGEREPTWETVYALAGALGVDCTAFTKEAADRPPSRPGRPTKHPAEEPAASLPPASPKAARRPSPSVGASGGSEGTAPQRKKGAGGKRKEK